MQHKTKSRTFRRKNLRTVSGTKRVYLRRKPKLARCSVTGETLKGVPRELPGKMAKKAKSSKRPERPYGGVLSSKAARGMLKARAREKDL